MFSLGSEDSLVEEQRSREGGPTTFLTRWEGFSFPFMFSYFRRFYDKRMEVGMVVNSVNASSVFLRN